MILPLTVLRRFDCLLVPTKERVLEGHKAIKTKPENVTTILAPPDDPLLADSSIDRFFICDTWHHIENQTKYLALMQRMLKPKGQVVMIDFQKRELPVGPPLEMKIAKEDLIAQMRANGFEQLKEHTFLPYQYFLVFTPRAGGSE